MDFLGENVWELFPGFVGSDFYRACHHAAPTQTTDALEYAASHEQ